MGYMRTMYGLYKIVRSGVPSRGRSQNAPFEGLLCSGIGSVVSYLVYPASGANQKDPEPSSSILPFLRTHIELHAVAGTSIVETMNM